MVRPNFIMKPERLYNARQYDERKPQIYYGDSVADYLTQPEFETMRQAEAVASMLNNAMELGYKAAKGDLRRWLNV